VGLAEQRLTADDSELAAALIPEQQIMLSRQLRLGPWQQVRPR